MVEWQPEWRGVLKGERPRRLYARMANTRSPSPLAGEGRPDALSDAQGEGYCLQKPLVP